MVCTFLMKMKWMTGVNTGKCLPQIMQTIMKHAVNSVYWMALVYFSQLQTWVIHGYFSFNFHPLPYQIFE